MTINQHNSVKHTFSVPNWSEMCRLVDVWQFFHCRKFPQGSWKYYARTRLIDNVGDYLYLKNQRMEASNLKLILISSIWDCTTFHNFLPMFKKKKIFKSWQVYDWLAKWLIMLGYMDLTSVLLNSCISGMGGLINMEWEGYDAIGCYTYYVTLCYDFDLQFWRSNFRKALS